MLRFNSSRARRRKRWRLARLLSLGFSRGSLTVGMSWPRASALAGLVHPHVPVAQPPDLPLGVAALDHALHELRMLFLGDAILLGAEADDGQQVFHLPEHPLLDDFAQFLVAGPRGIAAMVARPGAQ